MRIRNKKSFIVVGPEGKAPKSVWSQLTHALYLLLLAGLAVYLVIFFFNRLTSIEVWGQVGVERIKISGLNGGRIIALGSEEGAIVRPGDLLVRLQTTEDCELPSTRPLRKLRQSMALDRQRLLGLQARHDDLKKRRLILLDEQRLGVALELERRMGSGYRSLQRELDDLEIDMSVQREKIRLQEGELEQLAHEQKVSEDCGEERIQAPVAGRIGLLKHHLYEVVSRQETILTLIPDDPEVWVEAFFGTDDSELAVKGQLLWVRLPDGRDTRGRIIEVHSSAHPFPDLKHDVYVPEETEMRILISPLNQTIAAQWMEFDRMDVTVRGSR